jgi:fumarylpyruvate hydrolase
MAYIFPPSPPPSVAVEGETKRFAVRRIFCVGLNYAAHAREMGKDPDAEPPFFFTKPADAVVESGSVIPYASMTEDFHYELELVAALGGGGANIARMDALNCVYGYAAGIDLTRRDLQRQARITGKPWDLAKGFDRSAPLGAIRPAARIGHPRAGRLHLQVGGATRQDGNLADMMLDVAGIIAELSRYVALAPGDLIFTGTPEGVGPLLPGDSLKGSIDGVGDVTLQIAG